MEERWWKGRVKAEFRKGSGHIKVLADPLVELTPFNSELRINV